jgi:hypothetical protein
MDSGFTLAVGVVPISISAVWGMGRSLSIRPHRQRQIRVRTDHLCMWEQPMSPMQIVGNEFFKQLHRAITNVHYYGPMTERYEDYALRQQIATVALLIIGLLMAAYPWARAAISKAKKKAITPKSEGPPAEPTAESLEQATLQSEVKALVWGFFIAGIGFVIGMLPFATKAERFSSLNEEWTSLRIRIEHTEKEFYSLDKSGTVPPYIKDQLAQITTQGDLLVARDKSKPDKALANDAWEDANEILYGQGVRTKKQAEDKLAELETQHKLPIWPFPKAETKPRT